MATPPTIREALPSKGTVKREVRLQGNLWVLPAADRPQHIEQPQDHPLDHLARQARAHPRASTGQPGQPGCAKDMGATHQQQTTHSPKNNFRVTRPGRKPPTHPRAGLGTPGRVKGSQAGRLPGRSQLQHQVQDRLQTTNRTNYKHLYSP